MCSLLFYANFIKLLKWFSKLWLSVPCVSANHNLQLKVLVLTDLPKWKLDNKWNNFTLKDSNLSKTHGTVALVVSHLWTRSDHNCWWLQFWKCRHNCHAEDIFKHALNTDRARTFPQMFFLEKLKQRMERTYKIKLVLSNDFIHHDQMMTFALYSFSCTCTYTHFLFIITTICSNYLR